MLPSATEIRAAIEASVACEHNAAANKPEFVINSEERLNWLASKLNNYQAIIDSKEAILASKLKQLMVFVKSFLPNTPDLLLRLKTTLNLYCIGLLYKHWHIPLRPPLRGLKVAKWLVLPLVTVSVLLASLYKTRMHFLAGFPNKNYPPKPQRSSK